MPATPQDQPRGRVRNTRQLLPRAAADHERLPADQQLRHDLLIPHEAFEAGGEANGRALALPGARATSATASARSMTSARS